MMEGYKPPTDYGTGRRCAVCDVPVNRYTKPQPVTGTTLCNLHWTPPSGWGFGPRGLVRRKEPVDA